MITQIINDAKKYLVNNSLDVAHDVLHHAMVYSNCISVIQAEGLEVDWDALAIAAWWHDAEDRDGNIVDAVNASMRDNEVPLPLASKVVKIIEEHSYGKDQTLLESKVLYDADKLEYVSAERFDGALRAYVEGLLPEDVYQRYKTQFIERTAALREKFYFESSRERFDMLYPNALRFLEHGTIFPSSDID